MCLWVPKKPYLYVIKFWSLNQCSINAWCSVFIEAQYVNRVNENSIKLQLFNQSYIQGTINKHLLHIINTIINTYYNNFNFFSLWGWRTTCCCWSSWFFPTTTPSASRSRSRNFLRAISSLSASPPRNLQKIWALKKRNCSEYLLD